MVLTCRQEGSLEFCVRAVSRTAEVQMLSLCPGQGTKLVRDSVVLLFVCLFFHI